jgi:hypothetical protein
VSKISCVLSHLHIKQELEAADDCAERMALFCQASLAAAVQPPFGRKGPDSVSRMHRTVDLVAIKPLQTSVCSLPAVIYVV